MQLNLYKSAFEGFFRDPLIIDGVKKSVTLVKQAKRVIFIGNGGSNAICSHMMEDYMKIAGKPTLSFTDAALITCFANDYGYANAIKEWINFSYQDGDLLFAISSSGESENILNAVKVHREKGGESITLSGFKNGNSLSKMGSVNFQTSIENYGIVECFHQVILHAILDDLSK
ncbi:MAG: SIS domain-containing protein [Flavobacteriales bacterium]|nr:SIS domain-containing protein [Flavobacteriales bacterium]